MAGELSRIMSILNAHLLVFDDPGFGLELGTGYEDLLGFPRDRDPAKAQRLKSVLEAHAALVDEGIMGGISLEEIDSLVRWLRSASERPSPARTGFVPRNLGLSFARKGLGFPLFGYHRPPAPPTVPGLVVCHQSAESGNGAKLFVFKAAGGLGYQGLGARAVPVSRILVCSIDPRTEGSSPGAEPYSVSFSSVRSRPMVMDPLSYRYAYLFPGGKGPRLSGYLKGLFQGSYGIAPRDAEAAADAVIERSP